MSENRYLAIPPERPQAGALSAVRIFGWRGMLR